MTGASGRPRVAALSRGARHRFGKQGEPHLTFAAGRGVDGDCHAGVTVQHLSRIRRDPAQPNLRQVHLIAAELYDELVATGFEVEFGQLGENITTVGLDLLRLARGTRLRLGAEVVVEVTGLRNPCRQIEGFRPGMLTVLLSRTESGDVCRRAGVMSVVLVGGVVASGDAIGVDLPEPPLLPLSPV